MRIILLFLFLSHLTLVTDEPAFNLPMDIFTPIIRFCDLYLPAWTSTSWFTSYLFGSTVPLIFRLMEGGVTEIINTTIASANFMYHFSCWFRLLLHTLFQSALQLPRSILDPYIL
jgi:hypothetical protein